MSAVTSLTLMNADTDQPVAGAGTLNDDSVLDLAKLPSRRLNVVANVDSAVGSVRFRYDGNAAYKTENTAAYAMAGNSGADFYAWTPAVGKHTITATPYKYANASGAAGSAETVTFTVIDSSVTPTPTPTPTPAPPPPAPDEQPIPLPPTPGSFAHVYTVGTGGTYATIAAAAAIAGPGDQVLILPGTYFEPISLTRSGTAAAPITFTAQTPGTVTLDGAARKGVIKANGYQYVTIDGINVDHAANPAAGDPAAVTTSTGWVLKNMVVQNTDGIGVQVYGSNVYLYNVTAQYNGRQGIGGSDCSYVTVLNCTTRGNNTRGNDPDWDGGAGKWFHTDHVTIDGMPSYDNVGPGIWFDYLNSNTVIRNSVSYNNRGLAHAWSGSGIRVELNLSPMTIQNNMFYGNTGPQVDIQSSKYITVTGNTIVGTHVALKDWPRGSAYALSDIQVTDNRIVRSGFLAEGGTWNSTSAATKSLTIDRNNYQGGLTFNWNYATYCYTLADVRNKLNVEWNGTSI
jgi:hypothetical protein